MKEEKIKLQPSKTEWMSPHIWEWSYLTLKPLKTNVKAFAQMLRKENCRFILDLGCGNKPYRELFPFAENYIGFDIVPGPEVDTVGVNWDLPFEENEFDALLTTQVLEHTAKISDTVDEIRRVVKKDGLLFISAPLTYPEHEPPYDYYRFTRYGLLEIFKDFEVVSISSSGGFLNTLCKLANVFLNYFPYAKYWAFPIFFLNNIAGMLFDRFFALLKISGLPTFNKIYEIYMRMPENFMLVLRNTKE